MQNVHELKDLALLCNVVGGTASLVIRTDMPGGSMADRKTVTLTATTGRQTIPITLDGIRARLFQIKVTPASGAAVELYSGSVRARQIGEYLDGATGEIWETQPIALGG